MEQERATPRLARGLGLKVAIVIVLGLVMLVPLELVRGIILERAERAQEVTAEIAGKWAASQTLRGPFLLLPAERANPNIPGAEPTRRMLVLLPEDFTATAETATETRSRGIFDAEIYTAKIRLAGSFDEGSLDPALLEDGWRLRPEQAMLALGVSDPRGLQEDLSLTWDGKGVEVKLGMPAAFLALEGVHWPVQVFAGDVSDNFAIEMTLRGSAALSLLPAGRQSRLSIAGNWASPSFDGTSLPLRHDVSGEGFSAEWRVSHLARALPQSWSSYQAPGPDWRNLVVGVKFLDPVDFYRLSERSVKYGALFIALTFLVFFFFELLLGVAIHPVQYLLVGAALVVFFLSLVAFAEVVGFAAAYGLSALIVAGMISLYAAAVLRRRLWGGLLFALTAALYGLLFLILRLEEAALLSGTLVLLVALAVIMFATRRLDWSVPAGLPGRARPRARSGAGTDESPL